MFVTGVPDLFLGVLYALVYAKITVWARPCLPIYRLFQHIVTTTALDHIVATMTLDTNLISLLRLIFPWLKC
jgi:hypothetical protein